MTGPQEITAKDIVDAMSALVAEEVICGRDAGARGDQIGVDPTGRDHARAYLAELLDAWHRQPPLLQYLRTSRDSPAERAQRDPIFHALVQHLYQMMRQGEGQWTPTEMREAAMLAQLLIERERPLRFVLQPPPADAPELEKLHGP